MILTCPQCSTKYQADAAKFPPAGRAVRCAKCGHTWHQTHPDADALVTADVAAAPAAEPVRETSPAPSEAATPVAAPAPAATAPAAAVVEDEPRAQAFGRSSLADDEDFADDTQTSSTADVRGTRAATSAPSSILRHATAIGGWTVLVLLILVIGWSAVHYRRDVATLWPQSASLYSALGLSVNVRGIAFDDVTYHKGVEDGSPVLTVTGELVNISSRELPVPQIRIALTDKDKRELFSWTYVPNILTLKPGQVAPFRTRLASPPDGARHLELRFVKAGE